MNICEHLTDTAKIFPEKTAIVFEGTNFSYAQLNRLSAAAAEKLQSSNVTPGDRVAIQLGNVPAFVVWYYAILRIGGVAVALSTRLADEEVDFMATDCGAKVLIAPDDQPIADKNLPDIIDHTFLVCDDATACNGRPLSPKECAPPDAHCALPSDAALILYTSGTTGFAKGATLSHQNVRSNVCAFNHLCGQKPESIVLLTVPLFHCFGQNAILNACFHAGSTIVLQPKFDPNESKRLIIDHAVTQLYGVPAMFQMLSECCSPADLSSVSYCFSAATTLPIQVADAWRQKYSMPVHEGYGLTETSPFAAYNHRLNFVPGSIGTAIDGCEMKIVDTETGKECPAGTLGEIAIRGPNVMLGYWNQPDETAAAIRDGWFYSGDIGKQNDAGYFYIVDRVKDMISIGGLKVFPAEVERVLLDMDVISEVAVVGISGGVLGEQVAAWVVIDANAVDQRTESEVLAAIKDYSRQHLANYKTPKHVQAIEKLPRNPSGKILKKVLREKTLEVDSAGDVAQPALRTTVTPLLREKLKAAYPSESHRVTQSYLQNVIQSITGDDAPPAVDDGLLDVGLDSLMLVELSHQLQAEVGPTADISAASVFDYPRVIDLAAYLLATIEETDDAAVAVASGPRAEKFDTAQANIDRGINAVSRGATEIAQMTEEEVLAELMRELEE